jgi:hypothetical protein
MPSANKWEIREVKLADLEEYDENPREIDEQALAGLISSIDRFGYVEPIVWNEKTKRIVGGHQRLQVLKLKGVKKAQVVVVDMDDAEELAANLTLNNPEIEGEWDDPVNDLLKQLKGADEDLYDSLNLGDLEGFVESLMPRGGEDDYSGSNGEINIDELTGECDTKCPCCSFEWKIDSKDVLVLSPEEQAKLTRGEPLGEPDE